MRPEIDSVVGTVVCAVRRMAEECEDELAAIPSVWDAALRLCELVHIDLSFARMLEAEAKAKAKAEATEA